MNFGVLLFGLIGVGLLLALAALLGLSQRRVLSGPDEVMALVHGAMPEVQVRELALDADRRAALLMLADGRIIAMRTLGDRVVHRVFSPQAIRTLERVKPRGRGVAVRIGLADSGFPSLALRFDRSEPPPWMERLRRAAAQ